MKKVSYNQIKMAVSSAFDILSVLLGMAGIGIGIGSAVYNSQIDNIEKQMKALYKQNENLIAQSDRLQKQLSIMVNPQLIIANSRVQLALKANLAQVQLYYRYVGQLMQGHNGQKYHTIMEKLKSVQSLVLSPARLGVLIGASVVSIACTVFGAVKINRSYKAWKKSNYHMEAPQIPLNDLLENPRSNVSQVVHQSNDAIFVVRGAIQGPANIPVIPSIYGTQAASNTGSFRIFLREQFRFHGISFKESFNSFSKIFSAIGAAVGVFNTALQIKNLVAIAKNLDQVRNQLIEFENSLKAFHQTCLGVLYDMQTYLAALEAQLFSFSAFVSYVQLICTHNMLQIKFTQTQIQNQFAKYILDMSMGDYLKPSTFALVRQAKESTKKALQGVKIYKKNSTDPTKDYQYTTTQSFQTIEQKYKEVTDIFSKMDKNIKVSVIYQQFYERLTKSQEIIPKLSYRDSKDYAKFANIIKKAVSQKKPIEQIEQLYEDQYDIEVENFTQQDKFEIAQLISFFTDTYPDNQPEVYGYILKDFKLDFDPDFPFTLDKQIYDMDLSDVMGTWPKIKKEQSINQIYNKYKIDKGKLEYISSSLYMQPPKQLAPPQKGPKYDNLIYQYTLYRVQLFKLGKQSYYVLYDGVTNLFKSVELTLPNMDYTK